MTRGNLSTHANRLVEAGYVNVAKEFVDRVPRTLYSLTGDGRTAIETYRRNMRQVLDDLLS